MATKNNDKSERLVKLETEIEYIKNKVNGVDSKLDKFIESADNKYARRTELQSLKEDLKSRTSVNWNWRKFLVQSAVALLSLLAVIVTIITAIGTSSSASCII